MINAVLAIETKEFVHEGCSLGPRLEFPVPIIEFPVPIIRFSTAKIQRQPTACHA